MTVSKKSKADKSLTSSAFSEYCKLLLSEPTPKHDELNRTQQSGCTQTCIDMME